MWPRRCSLIVRGNLKSFTASRPGLCRTQEDDVFFWFSMMEVLEHQRY